MLSSGVCGNTAGVAWVSWQVTAQDVDVKLSGLTWDPVSQSWKPMVGQQVVATLVCPSWPDNARSWSASGPHFADYQPSQNWAQVTSYAQGSTAMQTSAFFRSPAESSFQCNLFLGGPFQHLVKLKRSFKPEKPLSTIAVSIGEVKLGTPEGYLELALLDSASLGAAYNDTRPAWVGIRWGADPETPAPWSFDGSSYWHWVQLVWPSRFWTWNGHEEGLAENGYKFLDHFWPYSATWQADGDGEMASDTPGTGLAHPPYTSVRTSAETFKTYLMYAPPAKAGFLNRWVALKEITWYWNGRADWDGATWTGAFGAAAQWSYSGDFPRQPEWAQLLDNPEIPGP